MHEAGVWNEMATFSSLIAATIIAICYCATTVAVLLCYPLLLLTSDRQNAILRNAVSSIHAELIRFFVVNWSKVKWTRLVFRY